MPILEYQRPKSGSVIERRLESGVIESYQSIRDLGQGGSGSVRLFASKTALERYAVKRPLEVQRHSLDYLKLEERLSKRRSFIFSNF